MNSSIARERIQNVLRVDSITTSEGDFLSTHVPINKLKVLDKFDIAPSGGKSFSEEDIYNQYVMNQEDRHQFIVVYGQSGTGKSHLIRWFAARYEKNKPKDEVVLFIRRSDNTLKGTIKQLLEKPEVQGIENKDVYERLVKASFSVEENKLKDLIYHNFIVEIDNDMDDYDIKLPNVKKRKLVAFLNNEIVHDYMMNKKGPIERMYSKIAEHSSVDRDTIAQFEPKDFLVSPDLFDQLVSSGCDQKAESLARILNSDVDGPETAKSLAEYLNQFKNDVIQRCAGIEPGDFKQIFLDIRKELHRLDKKLTLFIEDITSFTGVDTALLDALIEEHTGKREGDELCRISSVVGTTNNYLQNNFKDNHKDRITKYIYIPSAIFDSNGLFEFFARYLNTMSLDEDIIAEWVNNHANPEDYPIHDVIEGKNWEYVGVGYGKKINIYPFTKKSIINFYNNSLEKGHQTPRYIIRDIIEPVVRDALFNRDNFPSVEVNIINTNTTLSYRILSQISDENMAERLQKFISVWGDGTTEQYTEKGKKIISSIKEEMFDDFGLVIPQMDEVDVPGPEPIPGPEPVPGPGPGPGPEPVPEPNLIFDQVPIEKIKKVDDANAYLTKWIKEKKIDISGTAGKSGIIRTAVSEMSDYLFSAINWQAEGISLDNAEKVKNSSVVLFVALEGQTKNEGLYVLPASWESLNILLAFIRWKEYGNKSWKYPDADFDAYIITTWTESIKKELVKKISEYKEGVKSNYIEAAISSEIYRTILAGEFREKSLKNFNLESLFAGKSNKETKTSHCNEWNSLLSVMAQKNADANNMDTVRKYYNLSQGGGSGVIVLDSVSLSKVFSRVKRNKLAIEEDYQIDDKIKQRRDSFTLLDDIESRIESVAKAELSLGKEKLQYVYEAFGEEDIDEEDLTLFLDKIKDFYKEANKAQVNVKEISTDEIKKVTRIEKAISDIASVVNEDDPLTIIMAFSSDPISVLNPLITVLNSIKSEIDKANVGIVNKKNNFGIDDESTENANQYLAELKSIKESKEKLEGMVMA